VIPLTADGLGEGPESLTLAISSVAGNGAFFGTNLTTTVTIVD
jgi:hypothetical protein